MTSPENPDLVIRAINSSITIFSVPFSRFGLLPIGGRSTAVKLKNDEVFVLASSPADEATVKAINAMGTVKYLLTPDTVHALYISDFFKLYPDAQCIGPEGIAQKKPDVRWAGVFGEGGEEKVYGFEDEIKLHYFPGHANKEIATLHIPTRTLIQADLYMNLPPTEQYSKTQKSSRPMWPLGYLQDGMKEGVPNLTAKDKGAVSRDAKVVAAWDFDRMIPCHGDVIETGAKEVWLKAFKSFLE